MQIYKFLCKFAPYINQLMNTMKFIGIIPARYASTRFPAKPLAILGGKPVIQRVYEQVAGVLDDAYVATDDKSSDDLCPPQERNRPLL